MDWEQGAGLEPHNAQYSEHSDSGMDAFSENCSTPSRMHSLYDEYNAQDEYVEENDYSDNYAGKFENNEHLDDDFTDDESMLDDQGLDAPLENEGLASRTSNEDSAEIYRRKQARSSDDSDLGQEYNGSNDDSESDDETEPETEFYALHDEVTIFRKGILGEREGHDAYHKGSGRPRGRGAGGRKRSLKSAEMKPEIKMLQTEANEAYINQQFDQAISLLERLLKSNGEIYGAYTTLGEIHSEMGNFHKSLAAFLSAAHLKPKDPSLWLKGAKLALEISKEKDKVKYLRTAIYMYSKAIAADQTNYKPMFDRAMLFRELGYHGKAAHAYEQMLKLSPHDPTVLRQLARVYVELKQVEKAKRLYRDAITHHSVGGAVPDEDAFNWSDVNLYIEFFGIVGEYEKGIKELKSVARWMLSRAEETYWDSIQDDDREWDLDDFPRRIRVAGFIPGAFPQISYGYGLPLELRVRLGIYRLKMDKTQLPEALKHFAWLEPDVENAIAKVHTYNDLFREVAETLKEAGFYKEALDFFEPLARLDDTLDLDFYFSFGDSFRSAGLLDQAEECYQTVLANDEENIDARVLLAKLYEDRNMPEQAYAYVNEIILLRRQDKGTETRRDILGAPKAAARGGARSRKCGPPLATREQREENERIRDENVRALYTKFQYLRPKMHAGNAQAKAEWMDCASDLIDDFRNSTIFYPFDKHIRFLGYSPAARKRALQGYRKRENVLNAMEMMAERLQGTLVAAGKPTIENAHIPKDYRGISFDIWLDIFLEYALMLAKAGEEEVTYEIIQSALDAIVFYHSRDFMFQINVCHFTCALIFSDEETCCKVGRWFISAYQFTTDTYRLYSTLHRLCRSTSNWYNASPSQKFLLRQIRVMDFSLMNKQQRRNVSERVAYSSVDEHGNPIVNKDMDVALLTLYGHILYMGRGYGYALNYLFRAYALDPQNPMVNLSVGLAYLELSLKRQSENRHYQIMQGFSFLFRYYDIRNGSTHPQERQEANYNVARAFHMLGLMHLAEPYYTNVLELSDSIPANRADQEEEDLRIDAAYNLQQMYSMAGNVNRARQITEQYLTV